MFDGGIIEYTDFLAQWIYCLGEIWNFLYNYEVPVVKLSLIEFMFGSGIIVIITYIIVKWVLDFID